MKIEDRCLDFPFGINQNVRLLATFNQYMYFIMKMLSGSIIHDFGYLEEYKVRMEFGKIRDIARTEEIMY